jgi:uncharacterized protein
METFVDTPTVPAQKVQLSFDLRIVIAILVLVIAIMLGIWRPWSVNHADRTIEITGEAKISAEPDEYVFYPSYQADSANKETAIIELSKKSDAIVAKLKELGVPDNKIKVDTSGYDYPLYVKDGSSISTYSLRITITTDAKDKAQKIQDYLLSTVPTGNVTPTGSFSDAKRKELESTARDQAANDAKTKAEQLAKNQGFTLGKVKSISDGSGFGGVMPLSASAMDVSTSTSAAPPTLSIQPGENDVYYSVSATYYIR